MSLLMMVGYLGAILMGVAVGLVGAGGSVLTVPLLVYFFSFDGLAATADSLFVVGIVALAGTAMSLRHRLVNFRAGLSFAVPSFAGVFVARQILLPQIPNLILFPGGMVLAKAHLVLICFALLMLFASHAMIKSGRIKKPLPEFEIKHSLLSIAVKGFLVGCTTGFVGAGGGFLIIPSLVLLLHIPMRIAVGTSLAIIAANSLFGFTLGNSHHLRDWNLLFTITLLGLGGLIAGHYLSPRFSEHRLKTTFGWLVLLVAVFILADQLI